MPLVVFLAFPEAKTIAESEALRILTLLGLDALFVGILGHLSSAIVFVTTWLC